MSEFYKLTMEQKECGLAIVQGENERYYDCMVGNIRHAKLISADEDKAFVSWHGWYQWNDPDPGK
jgi:hypothetical protein